MKSDRVVHRLRQTIYNYICVKKKCDSTRKGGRGAEGGGGGGGGRRGEGRGGGAVGRGGGNPNSRKSLNPYGGGLEFRIQEGLGDW